MNALGIVLLIVAILIVLLLKSIKLRCPECGGELKNDCYDSFIDKCIWRCKRCGKEWI